MIRSSHKGLLLLLASALLLPGVSQAQEAPQDSLAPLQIGPVIVHPSLSLRETYSDNVFFTAKDTKGDLITAISPGVTFQLPFRTHILTLGTSAEFVIYADNSSLNVSPFQVFGLGEFNIGDRVKLKVGDTYQRNEESPLESPNGTSDVYTANAAALSVKYAFVDIAQAQLDYTRTSLDYLDSSYRTREEDLVSAYLYYRVMPNTSAFLEYDFKNVAYDTSDTFDNVVHTGQVGATWEFTEYSKGTAKIGFLAKEYSDDSLKDYTTVTASVDLRHQLTPDASVRLLGKRDVNEGKYVDARYYTTTGLFADFTYRFLERLSGVIEGSYAFDEYSNARVGSVIVREDKTAHIGLGAKYSFNSWLDFSLGYGYSNRNSNIADLDAIVNTVTFKVTAAL